MPIKMTQAALDKRREKFMPGGIPKFVRIYDNGGTDEGGTIDRYTVLFTGQYRKRLECQFLILGMDAHPTHPQGFGSHEGYDTIIDAPGGWAPAMGKKCHLGTRVPFSELPEDCQKLTVDDYEDIWNLATRPLAFGEEPNVVIT